MDWWGCGKSSGFGLIILGLYLGLVTNFTDVLKKSQLYDIVKCVQRKPTYIVL